MKTDGTEGLFFEDRRNRRTEEEEVKTTKTTNNNVCLLITDTSRGYKKFVPSAILVKTLQRLISLYYK